MALPFSKCVSISNIKTHHFAKQEQRGLVPVLLDPVARVLATEQEARIVVQDIRQAYATQSRQHISGKHWVSFSSSCVQNCLPGAGLLHKHDNNSCSFLSITSSPNLPPAGNCVLL